MAFILGAVCGTGGLVGVQSQVRISAAQMQSGAALGRSDKSA